MTVPHAASVQVDLLHPIFVNRLAELCRRVPGLYVLSGPRTQAKQTALWMRYLAGTGNLAANPYRRLGERTMFGKTFTARGSWHMVQDTGWAYAADMQPDHLIPFELVPWHSDYLLGADAPLGLTRTVQPARRSRWEPWHVQPLGSTLTVYDGLAEEATPMFPDPIYVRLKPSNRYLFTDGSKTGTTALTSPESVKAHRSIFDPDGKIPPSVEAPDALGDDLLGIPR